MFSALRVVFVAKNSLNSYVKRDGTQVKEHFRTINTDDYGTPPIFPQYPNDPVIREPKNNPLEGLLKDILKPSMNMDSVPVLQGGVSVDVELPAEESGEGLGSIGGILGTAAAVGLELAPIALQIYQAMNSGNGQAAEYLKPQFDTRVKQLDAQVAQMKGNIDNNISKLVNAKNRIEYSKIYEPLQKDWQAYQQAQDIVNRIKIHSNNNDYKSVANDLGNFVSNNQKQIISDLLQPDAKMQNYIDNLSYEMQKPSNTMTFNEQLINIAGKTVSPRLKVAGSNLQNAMQNFKYAKDNPHAHILNSRTEITNPGLSQLMERVGIPENSRGVIYDNNSDQSQILGQSPEIQNFIRANLQDLLSGNAKEVYEIEFIKREFLDDNYYGLQHCKLFNPQITSDGYFKAIIVDYYDFVKRTVNGIGDYLNNWGYSMQEKGFLENIFNIYIIFEKL